MTNPNFEECMIEPNIITHTQGAGERKRKCVCVFNTSFITYGGKKTKFGSCRDS